MIVEFVTINSEEFGVEPICTVLRVAPSTFYAARSRSLSARAVRDIVMSHVLVVLWVKNRKLYGAHKMWKAMLRAGHPIGRDQVSRLMRLNGIRGVTRKRSKIVTTRPDGTSRAVDLVKRQFTADRPDRLWVTDLTYVPTRSGMAYVCFIVDAYARRIVGWCAAAHMRTDMILEALDMAARQRGGRRLAGLVTHSDAGSQFTSLRYTERLAEIGAVPSVGTVADSYDNALAETVNGLYKTELVYGPDAEGWDDVGQLELATLSWVYWFNHERLHSYCGDIPPAEHETNFWATQPSGNGGSDHVMPVAGS